MQDHWKDIESSYSDDITTWDEKQKEIFRQHQVDKINACARKLIELEYFTGEQLSNTLQEYGVGRVYFEQMYQLNGVMFGRKMHHILGDNFFGK